MLRQTFHCFSIAASPRNASLPWIFFRFRCFYDHNESPIYSASSLSIDNSSSNSTFIRSRGSVTQGWVCLQTQGIPFLTSRDSWFRPRPVRRKFMRRSQHPPNFSANVTFSVWGLLTIIVKRYARNLFQQSVSCHFTWPLNVTLKIQ